MAFVSTHSRPKAAAWLCRRTGYHTRVSTHSRPKAAAENRRRQKINYIVSTHSRPKAAALCNWMEALPDDVSTHSRPKAAAQTGNLRRRACAGFNTQPPEGGCKRTARATNSLKAFQHTAARRRLQSSVVGNDCEWFVSTHSRPKAAAAKFYGLAADEVVSTHSRPKAAAFQAA